jgi:hypothetical protein
METFAQEREAWLRSFLELPPGIPSHDTLSDVLGRIDPVAFRAAFTAWATAALPALGGEQVGIDGKAIRGSREGENPAVQLVSAFAGRARWVLAQQAVAEKSNEITAIPDLLGLLDLEGAVVSIDAMGCQKTIVRTIVDGGADYVLTLKDNHLVRGRPARAGHRSRARAPAGPGNDRERPWPHCDSALCDQQPNRLARCESGLGRTPSRGAGRVDADHR